MMQVTIIHTYDDVGHAPAKSLYPLFRLVSKVVTLNDLEWRDDR